MLVRQPLDVSIGYRRKGKRNVEHGVETRFFPVVLREAADGEAPVVMRWQAPGLSHRLRVSWRAFDGSLWRPETTGAETLAAALDGRHASTVAFASGGWRSEDDGRRPIAVAALADALAAGDTTVPGRHEPEPGRFPVVFDFPADVRDFDLSRVESAQRQLDAIYADLLVVDGVVYRREAMPLLKFSVLGPEIVPSSDPGGFVVFDPREFDLGVRRWRQGRCGRFVSETDPVTRTPYQIENMRPEILRPDLLPSADMQATRVRAVVEETLRRGSSCDGRVTDRARIVDRPDASLLPYAILASTFRRGLPHRELHEALRAFLVADRGGVMPGHSMEAVEGLVPSDIVLPDRREEAPPAASPPPTGSADRIDYAQVEFAVVSSPSYPDGMRRVRYSRRGDIHYAQHVDPDGTPREEPKPVGAPSLRIDRGAKEVVLWSGGGQAEGRIYPLDMPEQAAAALERTVPGFDRARMPSVILLRPDLVDASPAALHALSIVREVVNDLRFRLPHLEPDEMEAFRDMRAVARAAVAAAPDAEEASGACRNASRFATDLPRGCEWKAAALAEYAVVLGGRSGRPSPEDEEAFALLP